jgi:hypothetical protein
MEAATTATAPDAPAEPAEAGSEAPTASHDAETQLAATGADATTDERDESGRYLSREAATYRRRLRDTEAERDDLRTSSWRPAHAVRARATDWRRRRPI